MNKNSVDTESAALGDRQFLPYVTIIPKFFTYQILEINTKLMVKYVLQAFRLTSIIIIKLKTPTDMRYLNEIL